METAAASTTAEDSYAAGQEMGTQMQAKLGASVDALIVFAAPRHDYHQLLNGLLDACPSSVLVGASSAGEFTRSTAGENMACALGMRDPETLFAAGIGSGLAKDPSAAARQIAKSFRGKGQGGTEMHRTALVMADALAGYSDQLVDALTLETGGQYQFFGGGAGDNAQFKRTVVFHGRDVMTDAAVALEMVSRKPIGIGVSHGWQPAGPALRVTEAEGMRLISLNGLPAADAFHAQAEATGQTLDPAAPVPFFLHNILGIDTGASYRLRVPLAIDADGAVHCAAEVPTGALVHIMRASSSSSVEAAGRATATALSRLGTHRPKAALFFDCVATRLRMGAEFGSELDAVTAQLGHADLVGCNTHGQIARAGGQLDGFHNCTAVVCLLPE